jgi:hypothetical protein
MDISWLCDGEADCSDGCDEVQCATTVPTTTSTANLVSTTTDYSTTEVPTTTTFVEVNTDGTTSPTSQEPGTTEEPTSEGGGGGSDNGGGDGGGSDNGGGGGGGSDNGGGGGGGGSDNGGGGEGGSDNGDGGGGDSDNGGGGDSPSVPVYTTAAVITTTSTLGSQLCEVCTAIQGCAPNLFCYRGICVGLLNNRPDTTPCGNQFVQLVTDPSPSSGLVGKSNEASATDASTEAHTGMAVGISLGVLAIAILFVGHYYRKFKSDATYKTPNLVVDTNAAGPRAKDPAPTPFMTRMEGGGM